MAPPARFGAHTGRCAIEPDLLIMQRKRARTINVEGNPQRLADIGMFDGKLPCQENLAAVPVNRKIGCIKARAVAVIEYSNSMRQT